MDPNQPNPYDFITSSDQNKRPGGLNFGGKKQQYAIGAIFSFTVLFIAIWIGSLLFSGGSSVGEGLIDLQSYQVEIDRVITLGQKNISDPHIKQQLSTLQASIVSDKKQLSDLLSGSGIEITPLQIGQRKDPKTDAALTEAVKLGTHDETLQQVINSLADKYYTALSGAKKETLSIKESTLVGISISNIETVFKAD